MFKSTTGPGYCFQAAALQLRSTLHRVKDASYELGRRELTSTRTSEIDFSRDSPLAGCPHARIDGSLEPLLIAGAK